MDVEEENHWNAVERQNHLKSNDFKCRCQVDVGR